MNKYFALRKTNRMRTELLTEKSQAQLENTESRGLLLVCCTSVFLFWVGD